MGSINELMDVYTKFELILFSVVAFYAIIIPLMVIKFNLHIYKKYGTLNCSHLEYFDPMYELEVYTKEHPPFHIFLRLIQWGGLIGFCFLTARQMGWISF